VDQTLYYGKGAGKFPTASAVVADIVDAARNVAGDAQNRIPLSWATDQSLEWVPVEDRCERSYFRLSLLDRPGSLAKVTQVLGNHGISINSLIQHELDKEQLFVPVVFITGEARLGNIHQAMQALSALPEVEPQITRYRLEELGS
jgi:homoserine dehydrogenase